MTGVRCGLIALAAWLSFSAWPALAGDPFGTAGRFRGIGIVVPKNCGVPTQQQMQGACDPPKVSPELPAAERAVAHVQRARELVLLLRPEAAYEDATAAIAADPSSIPARVFRIRFAMSQMPSEEILKDFRAAFQLAPRDPYLLATHADWMIPQDAKIALQDVSAAMQILRAEDQDMLFIRARAFMELDRYDDAKRDFDRALALEPGDTRIWQFRTRLHLRHGEFAQAIADATALLDRRFDIQTHEARALAYIALGRHEEAIEDLTAVLGKPGQPGAISAIFPQFNRLLIQRAILSMNVGRPDDATRDLDFIVGTGGPRAILRMQLYLKKNGFSDVAVDGKRSTGFDDAVKACFINQACGRGLVRSI